VCEKNPLTVSKTLWLPPIHIANEGDARDTTVEDLQLRVQRIKNGYLVRNKGAMFCTTLEEVALLVAELLEAHAKEEWDLDSLSIRGAT